MSELVALLQIYNGSDGEVTKALYARLEPLGPAGAVAVNLFRAHKASARAKVYRRGGYRGAAYDKKQWSIDNVCKVLTEHAGSLGIRWGWKSDPLQPFHKWVIYVDLPIGPDEIGQVSFHAASPGEGPMYAGEWDQTRDQGPLRICRYIQRVLRDHEVPA